MDQVRVAVAQLDLRDGDYAYNFVKIASTVSCLAPWHELIVLPETATSGFASREHVERLAEPLDGQTIASLRQWSADHDVTIICGIAERAADGLFNSAVVVSRGDLLLTHRKVQLWPDEQQLFEPGDGVATIPWHGSRLGALICFDVEFPEPARAIAGLGAGLLAVCDGNMDPYGPPQRSLAIARAIENQMFVAVANRVGHGMKDRFAGGSLIVTPTGRIVAEAGSEEEAVISATIDLNEVQRSRTSFNYKELTRKNPLKLESP